MNSSPALAGVQWLKDGVRLFFRQPGGLLAILFTTMLAGVLLASIFIGPILLPSLIVVIMQACHQADQGQRITPGVLLTGFRGPQFKVLCRLGLVYMAISLLLSVVAMIIVDPNTLKMVSAVSADPKAAAKVDPDDVLLLLMITLVQLIVWMGMTFAAPLIYWQKMTALKAVFFSVVSVWREAKAFVLMLFSWFGASLALSIVVALIAGNSNIGRTFMMWAGALCVVVLWCALFIAYRNLFGMPAAPAHIDTSA